MEPVAVRHQHATLAGMSGGCGGPIGRHVGLAVCCERAAGAPGAFLAGCAGWRARLKASRCGGVDPRSGRREVSPVTPGCV